MRPDLLHSEPNTAAFTTFNGNPPHFAAGSFLDWLLRFLDRSKQRDDLSELDDGQLADIGLTRREAKREAGKWFWE